MFVLELRVLPVLQRSPEGSGVPMDFADVNCPLLRIPCLAIQLDRTQNEAFKFNPETEFGILELVEDQFNAGKPKSS